jgi:hypothetical protein
MSCFRNGHCTLAALEITRRMPSPELASLSAAMKGEIVEPCDAGYEDARPMFVAYPLAEARQVNSGLRDYMATAPPECGLIALIWTFATADPFPEQLWGTAVRRHRGRSHWICARGSDGPETRQGDLRVELRTPATDQGHLRPERSIHAALTASAPSAAPEPKSRPRRARTGTAAWLSSKKQVI